MNAEQRKRYLIYATAGLLGLVALDYVVIEPAAQSWRDQSDRIEALRKKVSRGEGLLENEDTIRNRWAGMMRANLPPDNSIALDNAYTAFNRWQLASGVLVPSLAPQWQSHDDGYETLEFRATASGDQVSLGKFMYAMKVDPLPVNLEEYEITTRDAHGAQLTMTMRVTFARIAANTGGGTSTGTGMAASTGTNAAASGNGGRALQ